MEMTPQEALIAAKKVNPSITHIQVDQVFGKFDGSMTMYWAFNDDRAYCSNESWMDLVAEIAREVPIERSIS